MNKVEEDDDDNNDKERRGWWQYPPYLAFNKVKQVDKWGLGLPPTGVCGVLGRRFSVYSCSFHLQQALCIVFVFSIIFGGFSTTRKIGNTVIGKGERALFT